jgi:hypothetical protein
MTNTNIQETMNQVLAEVDFSMFRNRFEDLRPKTSEVKAQEFKEIFEVAMQSKTFINTHNGLNKEEKFDGFGVLKNGYIVLLMEDTYFCLNHMFVEEGKLHLSTMSVAGNIISKGITMEQAVANYNSDLPQRNNAKEIVYFYLTK